MWLPFLHMVAVCITYGGRDCLGSEVLPLARHGHGHLCYFLLPPKGGILL